MNISYLIHYCKGVNIIIAMDILQTYMFDFKVKDCFIERMHVPRYDKNNRPTKIGINTNEGLECGEYEVKNITTLYDYQGWTLIITMRMEGFA